MCDFYRQPLRDEVVWDIEKIYASHNAHVLRLDDFTHLLPKYAVIDCTRYNTANAQGPDTNRRRSHV